MQEIGPLFYIVVLIVSVVIHEIAHGYAALRFGDHTAEYEGRLTLNPLKHLDLFGSILLPLLLIVSGSPLLVGWAKPVPYNPENFHPDKRRAGTFWVAAAGILTNLAVAIFFSLVIRLSIGADIAPESIVPLASIIVLVNIVLALFNLMPIVPLDGSKILFAVLGRAGHSLERWMERYSFILLLVFIFLVWNRIAPAAEFMFQALSGVSL